MCIRDSPNTGGFQAWQTATIPNVPLTQGTHVITLFFEEGDININKMEFVLTGSTAAPIADYEVSPQMGCLNTAVTFTSVSVGTVDNYTWNFGEGAQPQTATGVGPHTVIYGTEGTKTVSLTVSNSIGNNTKNNSPFMVHNCNLGIENPNEEPNKITVFPNPSTGIFHLSKESEWSVYSPLGIKVKQGKGNLISISEHPTGIYFVKTNLTTKAISISKQ
nr:PKD domain-containing protein [Flavobacterium sp. ASV13]